MIHDKLSTKYLAIVDNKGKEVATLQPSSNGAGLWITGPAGHTVAIYSIDGQTCIGLYNSAQSNAIDIGLVVTKDGALIQVVDSKGTIHHITADQLSTLIK